MRLHFFYQLTLCPIRHTLYSTLFPVDVFSTLCPIGCFLCTFYIFSSQHFLLFEVLSHSAFITFILMSFCHYLPFNVLSFRRFLLVNIFYVDLLSHSTICPSTFLSSAFFYFGIYSVNPFYGIL